MMLTVLFLLVAVWCWFGRGFYFLRWPSLIGVVVFTSGHPLAAQLGEDLEPLAGPLMTLLFTVIGLTIMVRALFGSSRRRPYYHDAPRGYWRDPHRYERRHWNEW
jgi:hypothetical protein